MDLTIRDILDPVCGRKASLLGFTSLHARASRLASFSDDCRLGLQRQPQRRESSEEPLIEPPGHLSR